MKEREQQEERTLDGAKSNCSISDSNSSFFNFQTGLSVLTLSSTGQRQRFSKVPAMFLVNLGPNTSLSGPNWCLDCLTMESTTYRPATLYSGLHWKEQSKKIDYECIQIW